MSLTITQPDDWHVHFRDGKMLRRVVSHTASQFGRALVMPNLSPPVDTVSAGLAYRQRILDALPADCLFDPCMSLYLTDDTTTRDVREASECLHVLGFKLYPAGATTNSSSGVTKISAMMPILEAMAQYGVVLQVHGEVADTHIDIFDRESVFIEQVLEPIHREIPELRIVLEHITTQQGVEFVSEMSDNVAGTITPQHLMYNRNEMFRDGIRPHNYCLPVLKREIHRSALLTAATGADPSFFLGTDSAPHTRQAKQSSCGCAGIFSANAAMEHYAEVFDGMEKIDRLEGFASHFGADFYNLPRSSNKLVLQRRPRIIPSRIGPGEHDTMEDLVPLKAGESVAWSVLQPD
jgi:dihydroorotase